MTFNNTDQYVKRTELSILNDNAVTIANLASGGTIGTAATTVDVASTIYVNQTTSGQTITVPNPTNTAAGKTVFPLFNIGSTSFTVLSTVLNPNSGVLIEWTGAAYGVVGTSSGATNVTVAGGKTFSVNNTLTLAGTDGTTMTFPATNATIARSDAANTFTGVQTMTSPVISGHATIESVTPTGATGTGNLVFATSPTLTTPNVGVASGTSMAVTGLITSSGTAGIGYATGAGGTVSQATSRTTGVTLSKTSGAITLFSAAGSATPFSFTVTNTLVAATDVIIVNQKSGTDAYSAVVSNVSAGSYKLTITDLTGTTSEAPVFNVVVVKGVAA